MADSVRDGTADENSLDGLTNGLGERLQNQAQAARLVSLVRAHAPDERLSLAALLKLAELNRTALASLAENPERIADLVFCLGSSEIVALELCTREASWADFFEECSRANSSSIARLISFPEPVHAPEQATAAARLGSFKRDIFVRIAIADLEHHLSVAETMKLMSQLADECIVAALRIALAAVGERARELGRFCVLAMGKLGVEELNLSSDIDLVYLFERGDSIEAQTAAPRVGEKLTEILANHCFRVDLRLRPGGQSAPLVASFNGALSFYQSYGQTWERAALLRARPVAGDLELGSSLIGELAHFVFRRYLDFETLRQLRSMKRQIELELRSPDLVARDIKLGRGGIRELEFIIQALILVYGGRDSRLRDGRTLMALERLAALGYLGAERAAQLAESYLFLRDVEHKLQVVAGLQTHALPATDAGLAMLAARMGFGKAADARTRLESMLKLHRQRVSTLFSELLAGASDGYPVAVSDEAEAAWRAAHDPELAAPRLEKIGFIHGAESAPHLRLLAAGPAHAPTSPRRHEILDRLGPRLLDEISRQPDADLALRNLAAFIAAVGARTSFLALLEEHRATRKVLLRLFASSEYLSSLFIRHPEMLDVLVRSDLAGTRRSGEELSRELGELLKTNADFEGRLDALRTFRHQQFLRIALADLSGSFETPFQFHDQLTILAETIVRYGLQMARQQVAERFNLPGDLSLCVLAMGRLGAGEMTYNSDLDLIFVYNWISSGSPGPSAHELAAKVAQKLISILEVKTREGYAYKLDLRLRPSGNAGPLVTSLAAFSEYHRNSSALWERQAMVRGRVIAGDAELGAAVQAERELFVFGTGLTADQVREIAAMRTRMEHEIGAERGEFINLKQGPGGLVDVEFLSQMLALRYGHRYPQLRARKTEDILEAAAAVGVLDSADLDSLRTNYRFMTTLENRLRIETDQASWAVPAAAEKLAPLARRMGFEGAGAAQTMLHKIEHTRAQIRAIYQRVFATESGA